ncbi:N-acetylmuramoyl-L-alanine amidase [Alteriqipengyuania sp. NZ-12B]|uniref:N-acetylmuramoyl-L-alanine amidase n=1 Tax=Alteriqipengyuania abyssalis TaxID=2860200 RepID=A0ABS7PDY6_9SPHN|nr:N-acetylmuramoyl-L-alanine amidase [Alteriqipengyuania abyssalis]MBY8337280.1 N-acetylmuramoyl-L-alanine amidase [Alteriqipengyuania abyssalis]
MGDPATYHFDLDLTLRPAHAPLEERWWPDIRDAALKASSARIYDAILGVRAVVIHATAGGSSAGAASVIFDRKASFHWLVPDEDEPQHGQFVWATCHEARAAWHVRNSCSHPAIWGGRGRINHWSLGIEVVNRQVRTDDFSDWQIEATAQIVRYAWAKYPNLRHVVSHAMLDPARRSDPGSPFPWAQFREEVLDARGDVVPELVAEAAELEAVMPSVPCCMTV